MRCELRQVVHKTGYDAGRAAERAAVVAAIERLEAEATGDPAYDSGRQSAFSDLLEIIQTGKHLENTTHGQ